MVRTELNDRRRADRDRGFQATAGTTMLAIDFTASVTLQVASADTFVIHNGAATPEAGYIWILSAF